MQKSQIKLQMAKRNNVEYQSELLPIHATHIYRNDQGSADLQVIVTGSNNKDYAVKTIAEGSGYIPATELFCYELAKLIDIPTPSYDLITMRDESIAFGSVWEGGVHKIEDINQVVDILTGKVSVRDLDMFLSRVYGFDLFINNLDRHFGNYLFRQSYNSMIGLAFDYSRAWYEVDAFGFQSLCDKMTNTQICHQVVREHNKYDKAIAIKSLKSIEQVSSSAIERVLKKIPDEWLEKDVKTEVLDWWDGAKMKLRVSEIIRGL
tara:strand:+ start:7414 stop:8202 length:789 start_codon:yes stop_codon:yes gene_type:complete